MRRFSEIARLDASAAEDALRRHLGVCYDVCHAAVEFESAAQSLERLARAGVGIYKLQLSAALKVPRVDAHTVDEAQALRRRGLPASSGRATGQTASFVRYLDLAPAFEKVAEAQGHEWRVHCHVPIFLDTLPDLATTQDFLCEVLALHKRSPISRHLEVETYTFDVLPEDLRRVDVATAVARELAWVRSALAT